MRSLKLIIFIFLGISSSGFARDFDPNAIHLPPGFHISVYADNIPGARQMSLGKNGVVFVGSKHQDVYALIPNAQGAAAIKKLIIAQDLDKPHGVAYYQGDLYVGEISRILRYSNIDIQLDNPPKPTVIATLPDKFWHGMRPISFSPDGMLYVAIGMPCNTCDYRQKKPLYGTIVRMKPDGP